MKTNVRQVSGFEALPLICVLILIVLGTLGIISYQNTLNVVKNSIIESTISRTGDNSNLLSLNLKRFEAIIQTVSRRSEIQSMNWEIQKSSLVSEVNRLGILRFQVANLTGYAHSTSGDNLDLSDREWIQKALEGETYISEPFLGRIDNRMIFACSTPIRDKNEKIVGALTASINSDVLYSIVNNIDMGKTGYAFVVGKNGRVIANPDKKLLPNREITGDMNADPDLTKLFQKIRNERKGYTFYKYGTQNSFITYAPIPGSDWILALTAPEKEVFQELGALKNKYSMLAVLTIAFCLLSCLLLIVYIWKRKIILKLEKLVEEDRKLLKASAELEKIRTQFFANISHEFRTPLNVILSSIQLCKFYFENGANLNRDSLFKHLRTMKQNCYRLMRLVNNLIDTTKIDVGFLENRLSNNNIVKIVEDITMSIQEFTQNKGINLYFEKNTDERIIACDVDKIERIMLNLISNAIKFTDPGGSIWVKVHDNVERVTITVKDTGIGIPEEKQKVIFERFVQVEQTLTRNHEGSGIGLAMVKSFVEMHGGTIMATSEYGKGSEFVFELPVKLVASGEEAVHIEEVESQRRIERINIEFSDIYYSN